MPVSTRPATRHGRLRPAVVAAVLAVLAAGCTSDVIDGRGVAASGSGDTTATPAAPTGELTWGETAGEVTDLMPLTLAGSTTANANLTVRVLDGLFRASPQITYVADPDQGTATSSIDAGQQVVEITIDPDAVWADGQPITADDYEFTISTQRSLGTSAGACDTLSPTIGYDQIERTEKTGSKSLKVYFTTPYADWKGLFSGATGAAPLLSKHVLDKGTPSDTCATIARGWPVAEGIPLGAQNGPWLLTGQNVDPAGKTITLVPNPRYWGDKPKLAKLIYKTIDSDSGTVVTSLGNGSVDVAYPQPQPDLVSQLKGADGLKTDVSVGASYEHLDFNNRDPLLKYPQVRQAIALAIDRPALTAVTVGQFSPGSVPLGNRILLNSQPGYTDNSGDYAQPNVARAKQLIQSVGGSLGSDGIYRIAGRPLSFRVMTTQGNALRDLTISRLAAQVRPAGIALTGFPNPDIFTPGKPTSLVSFNFQIALFAWVGSPSLSASNSNYEAAGTQNYSRGGSAAIDDALQRMTAATDSSSQTAAANEADRLLWGQMLTLPLFQKPTLLAYRDTVQGLKDNVSLAGPLWNSDEIGVK